jgi:hypothetical protein
VVGRKLWELTVRNGAGQAAASHQVLCITHLPQLAGYGDLHLTVRKQMAGERTRTEVVSLEGGERVAELAAMLGSNSDAGRESVEEMLAEVGRLRNRSLPNRFIQPDTIVPEPDARIDVTKTERPGAQRAGPFLRLIRVAAIQPGQSAWYRCPRRGR